MRTGFTSGASSRAGNSVEIVRNEFSLLSAVSRRRLLILCLSFLTQFAFAQDPDFSIREYQQQGVEHFMEGRFAESVEAFDKVIELDPRMAPRHWQRGISLYYAGEYQKGVEQFELHQTYNTQDVENVAADDIA